MYTLIAFATQWRRKYGGINSFNADFLAAFGVAYQNAQIVCIVTEATPAVIEEASRSHVTLLPLPYVPVAKSFDSAIGESGVDLIAKSQIKFDPDKTVWLGYDLITGEAAIAAAKRGGGRAAVIHHMSYGHYESFAEDSQSALTKTQRQTTILESADLVLAIGPLLRDAANDRLGASKPVRMLIPGLPEIDPQEAPKTFVAFLSGRLGADATRVNQGYLGIAAFARAEREARITGVPDALRREPQLLLRGIDFENRFSQLSPTDVETDLKKFAEKQAESVINLHVLPYTEDRQQLYRELSRSTVALMPSWHEGFGLVAWEAIAAGVPLILGQNSGVYRYLEEEYPGAETGYVQSVDVKGKIDFPFFLDDDLEATVSALRSIAADTAEARKKASSLRNLLLEENSWVACCEDVVAAFDWEVQRRSVPDRASVIVEQLSEPIHKSTPPEVFQKNSRLLSNYVHVTTIGHGFFANVTHYREKSTGRDVAVKKLKEEKYARRFEREIKLMQALDGHPNIIKLIDFECSIGSYQHITPKAETNLYKYIKNKNSTLTLKERIGIFDQVLAAVSYAHSKNILHRDIAPTNVLVFRNEHVEVCDFGMGKDLSTLSNYTTSVVARYGQVYYVAPEQRDKLKAASERSDIYSLGKLLNFVLTGRDPDIIHPSDFNSVIEKATQYEPHDRYQRIHEFETAYNRLKSLLLLETSALPKTLVDLKHETSSVDWQEFHDLAARDNHEGHTYSDYVEPVLELLSRPGYLQSYYEATRDSFGDFLRTFISKLDELAGMTGWPFNETTKFGRFLRDVFLTVREPALKLLCLKEIWNLAYEQDRWAAQSIMQGLFDQIPGDIQTSFAVHILDSSVSSLPDSSKPTIPRIIKQALLRKAAELDDQEKRAKLKAILVASTDDERGLLKLFGTSRSESDEFDHPFLPHNVYRSIHSLIGNGVLNRERNGSLHQHQEKISLIPEAVNLVEELIIEDKVRRESIVLDRRNIAASGGSGSGAPSQLNKR